MQTPTLKLVKSEALPLSESDSLKLAALEARVEHSIMDLCVSLFEIREYNAGIFWRSRFGSFHEYVKNRFGYEEQHAGRLVAAGKFVHALEQTGSHAPRPLRESQIRPILNQLPEPYQIPCWQLLTEGKEAEAIPKISADLVKAKVVEFKKTIPKAELDSLKPPRKEKKVTGSWQDETLKMLHAVSKATEKHPKTARIDELLEEIGALIVQTP